MYIYINNIYRNVQELYIMDYKYVCMYAYTHSHTHTTYIGMSVQQLYIIYNQHTHTHIYYIYRNVSTAAVYNILYSRSPET